MRRAFSRTIVRDVAIVAAIYLASTISYAALGVRFDATRFPGYMQFIDASLLTDRLLESIWYYHANPPLLNFCVGIALKVFGSGAVTFINISFHALGFLLALCVYWLTLKLSISRVAAVICTTLVAFSPGFVLYENWLMYEFPATALLTAATLTLHQFVKSRKGSWGATFFGLLAVLLLTRSLFHLAWMVLIAALLAVALTGRRRQVLTAAAVPILVVAAWYGKNYYYFGNFSSSSWMGLGLSNISTLLVKKEELEPLVREGTLSRYSLVSRYQELPELFAGSEGVGTGIPVLDQVTKSTGEHNFNNLNIVEIDRHYKADAIAVARRFPASYVVGLFISNRLFFSPTSMNLYFRAFNRDAVRPMERVFDPVLYGTGATNGTIEQPHFGFSGKYFIEVNTSVPLIVLWIAVLSWGYAQARRGMLAPQRASNADAVVIGFITFTAVYVYVVGTTVELGENYRYRFLIEPLFLVLTVTAIARVTRTLRSRFLLANTQA
jgi:hypothetical protein